MKVLEQRAAMEEENKTLQVSPPLSPDETISFYTQSNDLAPLMLTPMESCQMASNNHNEFDQKPLLFTDDIFKDESPTPLVSSMESSNVALDNHNELCQDLLFMLDEKMKEDPGVISSATSSNTITDDNINTNKVSSLRLSIGDGMLQELQLPKLNMDWTQDSFWTQLCSPWLDSLMLTSPYANILNF